VHAFATQTSPPVHSAFAVQGQGPFVPPHAWQWFVTQAEPLAQSAVVLQPFGVHDPPTQTPPLVQSEVVVQVHAGFEPPQATQVLPTQVWPEVQSLGRVHWTVLPGGVPGATQRPDLQTVPCAQSPSDWHVWVHPFVVHSCPVAHPFVLLQGVDVGGATVLHP
jgi:hypothetical protein